MPGAAGLGVRRRCLRLWRPSGHQRSACRCYRFADPAAEDRYGAQAAGIVRDILRIYYLVVFLFAIQEFVTYIDHRSSAPFWTLLGISAGTLALLLLSWWKRLLPYALPLQTASIVVLSATLMYHIRNTSIVYNDRTLDYVFPAGTGPPDLGVGTRVAEQVRQFVGMVVMRDALMYNCIHWISLSVAGFSKWTVLSYVAVYFSTAVGVCENPFISEKVATMFMATVASLGFFLVSVVIERVRRSDFLAQAQLAHELQASQLADSVLNHMLKNALADVAADIEIFLAGGLGPEVLEDAVVCLRRGIRSCRERMVYLKMVAGQYAPVLNAINLKEFGQQLAAGRTVTTDLVDCTVLMDGTLLQLILENALSNALKHGHPDGPRVQLTIRQDWTEDAAHGALERGTFSFIVRNAAHPLRPPLSDEAVRALFQGNPQLEPHVVVPTLSDGVGLLHCGMAARLGGIKLSLRQEGDVVTFVASVEAELPETASSATAEDDLFALANQCPAGLKIFCLDDSAAARRLLEFHLKRGCPDATVRTYGAAEDDVPHFLSRALQEADIAVLDQNLDYTNPYQGTELCGQLLAHGFRGLVCIRSSDDSQDDQAKYAASGAHCSFGKDLLGAKMVQRLKAAYVLHSGCHDVGSRFGTNRHEPRIAVHSTPPTSVFAWPPSHPLSGFVADGGVASCAYLPSRGPAHNSKIFLWTDPLAPPRSLPNLCLLFVGTAGFLDLMRDLIWPRGVLECAASALREFLLTPGWYTTLPPQCQSAGVVLTETTPNKCPPHKECTDIGSPQNLPNPQNPRSVAESNLVIGPEAYT